MLPRAVYVLGIAACHDSIMGKIKPWQITINFTLYYIEPYSYLWEVAVVEERWRQN